MKVARADWSVANQRPSYIHRVHPIDTSMVHHELLRVHVLCGVIANTI